MRQKNKNTLTNIFSSTSLPSGVLKVILSVSLIVTASVSCTPSTTNNYLTANGSDKKLPDDDGYTGGGGTGDGGGGQGILCSDATKNPQFKSKLMVRDIFEALFIQKLKLKVGPSKVSSNPQELTDEELQFLNSSLKRYFGHAIGQLEVGSDKFWQKFVSSISFIDEEAKLFPSKDANSPIALPAGCKIVQIAFWEDSPGSSQSGTLYVDKALWSQLDSTNKLALLVHEYFFKEARQAGFKNSDFVRAKVGQLFSESQAKPLFKKWKPTSITGIAPEALAEDSENYKFCRGTVQDDPSAELHLYFHDKTNLTIPFLRSQNLTISSLQGFDFEIPPDSKYPWVNRMISVFNIIHLRSITTQYHLDMINNDIRSEASLAGEATQELSRRLRGSGFTNDNKSISYWAQGEAEVAAGLPSVVWSAQGFTPNAAIQFELENPVSKIVPNNLATPPDLNSQIYDLFNEEIITFIAENRYTEKSGPLRENGELLKFDNLKLSESEIESGIVTLFSALSSDVEKSLRKGQYRSKLENWNKATEAFFNNLFHLKRNNGAERFKLQLERNFGDWIYKTKLGIMTPAEKFDLNDRFKHLELKKNTEESGLPFILKKGKLLVQSNKNQVLFELSCEGAGEPYNRALLNNKRQKIKPMSTSIKFEIDQNNSPLNSRLSKNDISKALADIVSTENRNEIPEDQRITFHGEHQELKEQLNTANKIVIKSCASFNEKIEDDIRATVVEDSPKCLVINLPEIQSYYLVIIDPEDWITNPHETYSNLSYYIRGIAPQSPPE